MYRLSPWGRTLLSLSLRHWGFLSMPTNPVGQCQVLLENRAGQLMETGGGLGVRTLESTPLVNFPPNLWRLLYSPMSESELRVPKHLYPFDRGKTTLDP
ncbi:hypothetical protein EDB81DRAFT_788115 [Dactylonectria macrodidyma]|uniref:Uncharacterized protein n=1 Tax=Dactylonectria macrodidyma TaxID=307937 RepID=A0A9P9FA85_9HYPO|nr:hypothetical protein EDB81DRAFT_788115 [Dactylonectria macrodidyma]